jgi:hypothetical protein
MHQQLWGYKVEWKSVSRGTGGKKVEYHCTREYFKTLLPVGISDVSDISTLFESTVHEYVCSFYCFTTLYELVKRLMFGGNRE